MSMSELEKWTYTFADETGSADLNDLQSKYFGLGFFCTQKPEEIAKIVAKAKYEVWQYVADQKDKDKYKFPDYFHACEDPKPRRDLFMKELANSELCCKSFIFCYCDKDKIRNYFKYLDDDRKEFGFLIYSYMINFFQHTWFNNYSQNLFLVISSIYTNEQEKKLRNYLNTKHQEQMEGLRRIGFKNVPKISKLKIVHTPNQNDPSAQVADYLSWHLYNFLSPKHKRGDYKLIDDAFPKYYHDFLFPLLPFLKSDKGGVFDKNFPNLSVYDLTYDLTQYLDAYFNYSSELTDTQVKEIIKECKDDTVRIFTNRQ